MASHGTKGITSLPVLLYPAGPASPSAPAQHRGTRTCTYHTPSDRRAAPSNKPRPPHNRRRQQSSSCRSSEQAQVQFHVLSPSLVSKQLLVSGDISFRYCGCTLTGVAQGQRIRAFQPHLFLHLRSTTTCFLSAKAPSSMTQLQLPLIPTNYCTSYPPPPSTHDRRALAARDETQSRSTGQWSLTGHWPGQPFVLRRVLK